MAALLVSIKVSVRVQGYLARKKTPPPSTIL